MFQGFTAVINNGGKHVHLLVQSTGGFIGDGVALYNFFRALPIDLTVYNVGQISSVAVVTYLGAKKRKVSANATFMLHRAYSSPQAAGSERLQSAADGLTLDDQRLEAILRQHITLADDKWAAHKLAEIWFSAQDAVKAGISDEIADFAPPAGMPLFNV